MIIQATPSNYWISPTALHISLNALGNADYIHANASGDASILVYINGVIDYDNAHNYRKFTLALSSTAFETTAAKYIYVAIPRTLDTTVPSIVVFPDKPIDVYGKEIVTNPDNTLSEGEQFGNENYYYIFLQGIISASETPTSVVDRTWTHEIETGTLATSEASNTGSDSPWWQYNVVTELVTFTKQIASATFKKLAAETINITNLIFSNGTVSSIADPASYKDTDNDSIATPNFVSFFGNRTYLNKLNDDVAKGIIDFQKGIKLNGHSVADIIKSGDDIQDTDTLIMSVEKQLATFMRKDVEDSTDFIQTFTKGIKALLVQSGDYSTGMLGAGFTLKNDANGDSYIEVDRGLFRKTVTFYELLIQKIKSVGGQLLLSDTQMNCIKVEEQADSYRCYFKNNEDGKVIYNEFEVNDLARRQDFNVKTGSKYYWRKVIAIGDDYIDLSKTDCDSGSGVPEVGDDIIQIGNSSDTARQGAIVLSAYGPDSPYIKIYQGINSYILSGKERATLSPSKIDITADSFKFSTGDSVKEYIDNNVIVPCGNWQPGTSYLKNRLVTFNNQTFISTADTSDCPIVVLADENGDYLVDENGNYITPTDENGNITYNPSWKAYSSSEALEQDVAKFKKETSATFEILNDEIDSKVSSTTYDALNKVVEQHTSEFQQLPESFNMSITESVKEGGTVYNAINSSFTMNDDGITLFGKKLNFSGSVTFQDINKNIQSKSHTFTSQPTDADAYNVGDIWTNATYGQYQNDILKCVTSKTAGAAFDIAHWQVASKYTDDTAAQAAVQELSDYKSAMITTINGLQSQIDGEVDSWFNQVDPTISNAPASEWTTDILKQRHANDTYTNTNTGASWKWIQTNNVWGWTPIADTATQKALANAAKAQDTADGKRRVFTAQPTTASVYDIGDVWVNATYGTTFTNDFLVCITAKATGAAFNIAHWKLASKYTDDTAAQAAVQELSDYKSAMITTINGLQSQIDGEVDSWFNQVDPTINNAPASEWTTDILKQRHANDTYTNTNTGASWKWIQTNNVWGWTPIADTATQKALANAAKAQDTADGKRRVFTAQPLTASVYDIGDVWVNATYGTTFTNDFLVCITAKATGAAFNIAHWKLASKYTDDTAAQAAVQELSDYKSAMITTINGLQSQIDGEVDSWFNQVDPTISNAPASEWTTDILKQRHANDTYTNTNTGASWKWIQTNNVWGWTPIADTATQKALANAAKAQDTADGKRRVFTAQPTADSAYEIGDVWVNATYGNMFTNDFLVCITAKATGAAFNITHWKLASKYTDDTAAKKAQDDATAALDYRDTFAKNLGYASLADMVAAAQDPAHKTIIDNGYINTTLLKADIILLNALQGKIIDAQDATIENLNVKNVNLSGNFRSPLYYVNGVPDATYHNNICITGGSTITLHDHVENVGRLIRIIYSYKSDGTLSTGNSTIKTSGSKIYEDGVPNDSIIVNREMVELLGMGNETTFFGWQVLNRIDTVTEHSYGRKLKVIAEGIVTGSSSGASIRGRCWDNRIDFAVSRQGVGIYVIAFTSEINIDSANDIIVMATGVGHAAEDTGSQYSPIKATVAEVVVVNGTLTITIITSDDATKNDGSFNFMITNMNDFGVE